MKKIVAASLVAGLVLVGCAPQIPKEALQLTAESLEQRQLQTRMFETADEAKILESSAQVLQDLGFNLEKSEPELGIILATKDRDARETGQIVGAIVMAALFGVYTATDKEQKIRASLITRPVGDGKMNVRITFQRLVWNTNGQISRIEGLNEPEIYQQFFEKLSQSVFLTAQEI